MTKVRLKWLRGRVDEDDGESDGETAALRESLQVGIAYNEHHLINFSL